MGSARLRLPTQPGGPTAHVGARRAAAPCARERACRWLPFSLYGSKRTEKLDMAAGLQVVFITPDTVDNSHELSTALPPKPCACSWFVGKARSRSQLFWQGRTARRFPGPEITLASP